MEVFENLKANLVGKNARIVLPEGEEPRILQATKRLVKETEVIPVLLGNPEKIKIYLEIEVSKMVMKSSTLNTTINLKNGRCLVERRKGKMSEEDARKVLVEDVNYFGVMLVYLGLVDGMVSGAIHSTAATVRPALQIIKTRPNVKRTSGAFLMVRGSERYLFGDCAININPDAEGLAEIAINSGTITAKMFGIDPKIAMLSYSTKGSGFGESVDKVVEATKLAHELRPDLEIDGELQFDAAFVPATADLKAPGSKVAGQANVFIFPGIEAGNIGYKMAERLGGFAAVGPVLQGLNKPVNDLSRGCNSDDVYKLTLITAAQAVHQ